MITNRILILFAHPAIHKSRVNTRLIEGIRNMEGITFHNLYEEYPNFHINVKREQQLLLDHDIIIWHHPLYWYSAPAILKEWIDLVLKHGFAYGRTGTALKGKKVMTVLTSGGRKEAYSEGGYSSYTINQFLAPFRQTARLCNMEYYPPFVVHGTHLLSGDGINAYAADYKKIIISLRDDIFSMEDIMACEYSNDLLTSNKSS
jgi:glutathione-regulated potassium-efflux system ancillary protein KefG